MKKLSLLLIKVYQKTLSPDHGPVRHAFPYGYCKFTPTCSVYTYQAIEKYGFWKGWRLGLNRIGRCNPSNSGGIDPVK